jgi:hypothetical protein
VVIDVPSQVPCNRIETFSSIERAERAEQELKLAEEKRIMAQSARKASLHQRQAGAVKSRAAHQQRLNKLAQAKPR